MSFLGDYASSQAKRKSNSELLREARNDYSHSSDERISDTYRSVARKELLDRGYNPRTGKFGK